MRKCNKTNDEFCTIIFEQHNDKQHKSIYAISILCITLFVIFAYLKITKSNSTASSVNDKTSSIYTVEKNVDMDELNKKYYISLEKDINWSIDLDGDKTNESICYKTKKSLDGEESSGSDKVMICYLYIDDELVLSEKYIYGCKDTFNIVDLSKDDNCYEIELDTFDYARPELICSNFYRWTDKVIYPIGSEYNVLGEEGSLNLNGTAGLSKYSKESQFLTKVRYWDRCKYDNKKHIFNNVQLNEYDVCFNENIEMKSDLLAYTESNENSKKVSIKAQSVKFTKLKKDNQKSEEWIYIKASDGTKGWIVVKPISYDETGGASINGDIYTKYFEDLEWVQ